MPFHIRIHREPGLFACAATVLWVPQEARLAGVAVWSGLNGPDCHTRGLRKALAVDSFLVGAALLLAVRRVPSRVREGQEEQVALRRKRGLERLNDFPHWEMPEPVPQQKTRRPQGELTEPSVG